MSRTLAPANPRSCTTRRPSVKIFSRCDGLATNSNMYARIENVNDPRTQFFRSLIRVRLHGGLGHGPVHSRLHIAIDHNRNHRPDFKVVQRLATTGTAKPLLEKRTIMWQGARHDSERQKTIAQLTAKPYDRLVFSAEHDRNLRIHVKD